MEERLIDGVRDFPCLWQVSSRAYKDLRAKENAWKAVVAKVGEGYTVDDCNKKWKSLRDKYVREIKKVKVRKTGSEGPVYVSCWPLFSQMSFIADTVKHRTTTSNFIEETIDELAESQLNSSDSEKLCATSSSIQNESLGSNSITDNSTPTPTPPSSSPASPRDTEKKPAGTQPKKKRNRADDIDELLVKSLNSIQEKKSKVVSDEEGHFGQQVAATLRRFTPWQKAFSKLRIQQVLTDIEFQPEFGPSSSGSHQPILSTPASVGTQRFAATPISYSTANYYNSKSECEY